MNLGFDAKRFFFNNTGLGNYSRTLLYGLLTEFPENNYFLFSPKAKEPEERFKAFEQLQTITASSKTALFWRQLGINKEINARHIDIFHGLSHEIPMNKNAQNYKSIVTMHDLIYKIYPHLFSKIDAFLYEQKYRNSCNRADRIIAISESTKRDLMHYYQIKENKISVVYQSSNPVFNLKIEKEKLESIRVEYNLPKEFILYVGSIIKRKNLKDLVEAVGKMPQEKRIPIVAVGNGKEYLSEVKQTVEKYAMQSIFHNYQHISNEILPAFYQLASLFVYTSSYEGFGIPVIEALNSGIPVITSNVSSLPEAGGDAALLVNPGNSEELQQAIFNGLENNELRKSMIEKGYLHAAKFTSQKMAVDTMQVYKELN
jgi:glycosyltransferase involved in cell wall biosynthesis